jgi:formylmethanofuran dehydrogenase subunit A
VVFGQTVTISGDIMFQFQQRGNAKPRKPCIIDIELEGGCGVVPFRYEQKQFVNALQWTIGLEILLLVTDPWRVFLTTDHPNGGSFTSYPHLIALLMDRSYRDRILAELHPDAVASSSLKGIEREYSLEEIAIMTRAAPARILGLKNLGHLGPGAQADITIYRPQANIEAMFACPHLVLKRGKVIVRDGVIVDWAGGATHTIRPQWEIAGVERLREYVEQHHTLAMEQFVITDEELELRIGSPLQVHPLLHSRRG